MANKQKISETIAAFQQALKKEGIDAFVVTGTDPHQSEYLADFWNIRKYLSGFSGSAGQMVVTPSFAGLWTDSRYFLQGEVELADTGISLMKQKVQFNPEYLEWISTELPKNATVAVDFSTVSTGHFKTMNKVLGDQIKIIHDKDVLAGIWQDRSSLPKDKVFILEEKYCGASSATKLDQMRKWLEESNLDAFVITTLDDIAWVLNLRGSDIECNPVFFSYLLVDKENTSLYIDGDKIDGETKKYLGTLRVSVLPYDQIFEDLSRFAKDQSLGYDSNQCHQALMSSSNAIMIAKGNPMVNWKACKNEIEIENIRQAMVLDGVALTKGFIWLEDQLDKGNTVTEFEFSEQLTHFRAQQNGYLQDSFAAIVGYKGNGAIIHYRPSEEGSAQIKQEGVLLIDSGGQYLQGTTDITRTIAMASVNNEIKGHYTRVLKGMIALSVAVFPKGTMGGQLEVLARQFLWQDGLNYGHGTGHGVGFCLNVHEAPQGFAGLNSVRGKTVFEPGMLTSNEPGYYKTGEYGIRIENLLISMHFEKDDNYLKFETVTLFPIDTTMIDFNLLTKQEVIWINDYHSFVFEKLSPQLNTTEKEWLQKKCEKI